MKTRFLICWMFACFTLSGPSADTLQVGAAVVKINPAPGTPMAGYYHERGSRAVADDLFAKAAVMKEGNTSVAIVVCDLISLPRYVVVNARKEVEAVTGIPGSHVMLAATHQHTGPVIPRGSSRDDLDGGAKDLARQYVAALPKLIAEAVRLADQKAKPVKVSYAREHEDRLAFNRRFWMKDGTVGWNPGKMNPNMIRPVGPIDPEVGVVYMEAAKREPVLTFVNYAMHPDTTGGSRISADYPGALSRVLSRYRGPDMVTLFANGACGNLNHVNFFWDAPQQGTNEANRLGTILAASVFKAYMDLKPVSDITLKAAHEKVLLPLPEITETDVEEARAVVKRLAGAAFMDKVRAFKVLDVLGRQGAAQEVEVQVIAMGKDLAWVSLPGEIFVELGLSIKAASPFQQTHIVELANGSIGYIPNRSAYAEGNYEVVSARCAAGSGEQLVTAAVRMLKELYGEMQNEE